MTVLVRAVTFAPDGSVLVEYADTTTDFRENGLAINHIAMCPPEEYEDEIDKILDAARELVQSVLIDKDRSPAVSAEQWGEQNDPEDDD